MAETRSSTRNHWNPAEWEEEERDNFPYIKSSIYLLLPILFSITKHFSSSLFILRTIPVGTKLPDIQMHIGLRFRDASTRQARKLNCTTTASFAQLLGWWAQWWCIVGCKHKIWHLLVFTPYKMKNAETECNWCTSTTHLPLPRLHPASKLKSKRSPIYRLSGDNRKEM